MQILSILVGVMALVCSGLVFFKTLNSPKTRVRNRNFYFSIFFSILAVLVIVLALIIEWK